jgi:hypothetical protein
MPEDEPAQPIRAHAALLVAGKAGDEVS